VLPDKERIYPDKCYPGGVVPAAKAGVYDALLADLAAAGIPTVDLAAALRTVRAVQPDVELYFRRDTHWRPQGALAAGRAMAAAIEQRFGGVLGPRVPMGLAGVTAINLVGDLPANMGILTVELPDPVTTWRTAPLSLLAHRLAEVREYYGVELRPPGGAPIAMDGKDPNAPVLMLGASFAEENGMNALALFLQRPVRGVLEKGTSGQGSLRRALPELRAGTKARVVVWELAERGFFDEAWRDPRL
jgi:hypothetical protein